MKRIISILAAVLLTAIMFGQAPQKMSYQAVIRDTNSELITSSPIGIRVSILQGSETGTPIYVETHTTATNKNGLVTLELGGGTPETATFADVDWSTGTYFLKTETDPTGGDNYTAIIGTSQLLSVPYALNSKSSDILTGEITESMISDLQSYLTIEIDPVFSASPSSVITATNISNWNTAYGWGDQTPNTDATLTGNGTTSSPLGIARQSASTGEVLKWNGTTWSPGSDLSGSSIWSENGSDIYYNGGHAGIGTSAPATYLHLHGDPLASRGQLSLSAPSGEDTFISFYEADEFKAYLWYDISDEDLRLQNFTSGALNLNPYGGRVGVGTNSPSTTLHVNGQIRITGGSPEAGRVLTSDGTGLATWETPSGSGSVEIPLFLSGSSEDESAIIVAYNDNGYQGFLGGDGAGVSGARCNNSYDCATRGYLATVSSGVRGEYYDYRTDATAYGYLGYGSRGVYGRASYPGYSAGYFAGDVQITGNLSKGSGSFKIDHPLEPDQKYLQHSFVESPDMKNIYDGNIELDANGEATIQMPEWFEALNMEFRYQLTCIGGFANVYIAEEIENNHFKIAGGTSGLKVSWQVTGVRKDAYAAENRIQVEVAKEGDEVGKYMHPRAFGLPEEMGVGYEEIDSIRSE